MVGISKLARVVEVYAKRLQIQEKMTAQIANSINDVLRPQGVAVIIKASHHCMTTRGVHKPDQIWSPAVCWAASATIRESSGIPQHGRLKAADGLHSSRGRTKNATLPNHEGKKYGARAIPIGWPRFDPRRCDRRFTNGKLAGHVGDQEVLLVQSGTEIFAIAAHCSHYHGPLIEGLVVGDTIRCPWHHACFDLRTGEAVRAPAISSLPCWRVEQRNARVFVHEKREQRRPRGKAPADAPDKIVIVGGGAAGFAAAEMLRRREFRGSIVMLSSDAAAPVDRPNLSKDYLAGSAPEEWIALSPDSFYDEAGIDLHLNTEVTSIDTKACHVITASGAKVA